MPRTLIFLTLMMVLLTADAGGQPAGYVDCYGGIDADGQYWFLLDRLVFTGPGRPAAGGRRLGLCRLGRSRRRDRSSRCPGVSHRR